MRRRAIWFERPHVVAVRDEPLEVPGPGAVLVQTVLSAISAGTELLILRGEAPSDLAADDTLAALQGRLTLPLRYGYAAVGRVSDVGPGVAPSWLGRLVFAFQPHVSHFTAPVDTLISVPEPLGAEDAVFLPNMETAVNLVLDAQPLIGEQVVVVGQGIVGLLTVGVLARFPLARLITLDRFHVRREASLQIGAHQSLDPAQTGTLDNVRVTLTSSSYSGADLAFELSGSPAGLETALALVGYHGRVVIGSWYGRKRVQLDLGGRFHRSKITMVSSQVSRIAPPLTGRWTAERRIDTAWRWLGQLQPSRFITHRFPVDEAADAYRVLVEQPEQAVQVVFTYA